MDTSKEYIEMYQKSYEIKCLLKPTKPPRQDQIQELMSDPYHPKTILIDDFCLFANKFWNKFTSMDQLWLAYYMHQSYSKVWNGTNWIKKY